MRAWSTYSCRMSNSVRLKSSAVGLQGPVNTTVSTDAISSSEGGRTCINCVTDLSKHNHVCRHFQSTSWDCHGAHVMAVPCNHKLFHKRERCKLLGHQAKAYWREQFTAFSCMCGEHCDTLRIAWQYFYPHWHPKNTARTDDVLVRIRKSPIW